MNVTETQRLIGSRWDVEQTGGGCTALSFYKNGYEFLVVQNLSVPYDWQSTDQNQAVELAVYHNDEYLRAHVVHNADEVEELADHYANKE